MEEQKPFILISNDDGIDSPGIFSLVNAIKKIGEVVVAAPDRQQSAVGHALTVANPLRVTPFRRNGEMFGYAVNGTPADCVKLAISNILERKPDMVISGINHGQNTAINILYSGTVSAATEGNLLGIPSIAVSVASYDDNYDCTASAEITREIVKKLGKSIPKDTLLNINIPALKKEEIKGTKVTRLSDNIWMDSYEKRKDPFGRSYFWFAGKFTQDDRDANSDHVALEEGYVTVTPIKYKFTDDDILDNLKFIEQ